MKNVRLPFLPEFKDRLLAGGKTCTARTKKHGEPGDTFQAYGRTFEITAVERRMQAEVCLELHKAEGFSNTVDFIKCWEKIHPGAGYRPGQKVWVHHFRILEAKP